MQYQYLLDTQLVDLATDHAPAYVQKIIHTLQSTERIKEPIRAILTGAGVGKTTLAQAIAQKAQTNCKLIAAACTGTRYLFSEQEHLLQAIVPLIEQNERWVVVLDNIDCLRHYSKVFDLNRGDYNDRTITYDPIEAMDRLYGKKAYYVVSPARVLCDLLDMFKEKNKNNIAFIGTAREPEKIPDFLKKRFETINIPLPNQLIRTCVLEYRLSQLQDEIFENSNRHAVAAYLASHTDGLCQFGLKSLVENIDLISYENKVGKKELKHILKETREYWKLDQGWREKTKHLLKNNTMLTASLCLNAALAFYILHAYYQRAQRS